MKLALGTAQLGMPYGIANVYGQPHQLEALNILQKAVFYGINLCDTSPSYGASEKIIGQFNNANKNRRIKVVTKIPYIDNSQVYSLEEIYTLLKSAVLESCANLNLSVLDYCLLHAPVNMKSHEGMVVRVLEELKHEGLIKKIGVSVYSPVEVKYFLEFNNFDAIQIPLNVFDNRLIEMGLLAELYNKGIEIHARSIYLQGLLLMEERDIPSYLNKSINFIKKLGHLAREISLTPTQLAFLYIRDMKEVNRMIIGCETLSQLEENIMTCQLPPLQDGVEIEIRKLFTNVPEYIINPSKWGK